MPVLVDFLCSFGWQNVNLKIKNCNERQMSIYLRLKNCNSGSRDSGGNLVFPLVGWKQGVLWRRVKESNYMSWRKEKKSFSIGVKKLSCFGLSINQLLTLFSETLQLSVLLTSQAMLETIAALPSPRVLAQFIQSRVRLCSAMAIPALFQNGSSHVNISQ